MEILQSSDITLNLATKTTKKNSFIANCSGVQSFGTFPSNNHGFPSVSIYLKLGIIGFGSERLGAFGLRHIWEKHGSEIGISLPSQIPSFIESILQPGSVVIIDRNKCPDKPLIIESNAGMIIVGLNQPKNAPEYFNIISAYDRRSHPGIVIATI